MAQEDYFDPCRVLDTFHDGFWINEAKKTSMIEIVRSNAIWSQKLLFRLRMHVLPLSLSALRRAYWRMLGMRVGALTRLGRGLIVTWPHRIQLGERCSLEHHVYLNVAGGHAPEVAILIGPGTFIGSGCEFNAIERIETGENCLIASGSRFIDHNHGTETGNEMKLQQELSAPIRLGRDVWIGANCIILKGVEIGDSSIVAAGSVVTKSVPPSCVVAGVPARVIRRREKSHGDHSVLRVAT